MLFFLIGCATTLRFPVNSLPPEPCLVQVFIVEQWDDEDPTYTWNLRSSQCPHKQYPVSYWRKGRWETSEWGIFWNSGEWIVPLRRNGIRR